MHLAESALDEVHKVYLRDFHELGVRDVTSEPDIATSQLAELESPVGQQVIETPEAIEARTTAADLAAFLRTLDPGSIEAWDSGTDLSNDSVTYPRVPALTKQPEFSPSLSVPSSRGEISTTICSRNNPNLNDKRKLGIVMDKKIEADESVALAGTEETDVTELASKISDTEPRYSFLRYTHEVDGRQESPIVFIYTCPAGSKIKERMIYASFKQHVLDAASQEGGFKVAKKLEASSPSEITPETIEEEFHPKQEQKQGFARPKRPGRR
ncbi:MAG: hypothetical protein LQ338_000333 [Usnochroma carphineum]|nr:MAG: hypothetical protein LQ338_000333 [Usnochroma carphineum]